MTGPVLQARPLLHLRWRVCALLFFATTINYVDRQVIGLLKPVLERELHWSEANYGWIVFAFQLAYAFMMPVAGRIIDWLGTRAGYLLAVTAWSAAAMGHALAGSAAQFSIARFALGVGEAGNFPAALRTIADWFPPRERALATGLFNSGANVGAVAAPLIVPWIASRWGWRAAFLGTGAIGFVWVLAWAAMYRDPREHKRLSAAERSIIAEGREEALESSEAISFRSLLRRRQTWAFLTGKFLTDPVWWFFLFWLPAFLYKNYGLNLTELGPPLIAIYVAADLGSIGGGWLSSALIGRGWPLGRARKTAMLACALCVLGVAFVPFARGNLWITVLLVSMATAGHQGWSANLYMAGSDLFPRNAVASIVGLGGFGGAAGGMLVSPAVGYWLQWSGGAYGPLFVIAAGMYLIALAVVQTLAPRWARIDERI